VPGGDRAPCATTLTCLLAVSPALAANLPLGKWNTIDDKTGKVKSEVQLYDQAARSTTISAACPIQTQFGRLRWSGSARSDWWAVKDSNLGPAD